MHALVFKISYFSKSTIIKSCPCPAKFATSGASAHKLIICEFIRAKASVLRCEMARSGSQLQIFCGE
ncbi:MAG: hypothetical protein ACRENG_36035, partial [bacterium]